MLLTEPMKMYLLEGFLKEQLFFHSLSMILIFFFNRITIVA